MGVAYPAGQRPASALKIPLQDVRDGIIHVHRNKTKAAIPIAITGQVAVAVERIRLRKLTYTTCDSRLIVRKFGRTFGVNALSRRFRKAANAAPTGLQTETATDKLEQSGNVVEAQHLLGYPPVSR